jgi:hypothetical protein
MQDDDRAYSRQILLVALFARHVPHFADKSLPVEKQNSFGAETDPRIIESLGQNRCLWKKTSENAIRGRRNGRMAIQAPNAGDTRINAAVSRCAGHPTHIAYLETG